MNDYIFVAKDMNARSIISVLHTTLSVVKLKCKIFHSNKRVCSKSKGYATQHTYIHVLYLNTINFKATKACRVVYLRIILTYSKTKHIYKSNILLRST